MFKIDSIGATPENEFTEGNLPAIQPTKCTDEWLNVIQNEFVNIVEGFGVVLNKLDNAQVFKILNDKFRSREGLFFDLTTGFIANDLGLEFQPIVTGNANEIEINDSDGAVFIGSSGFSNVRKNVSNTVVPLTSADGSDDRFDLVSLNTDTGDYTVTEGTPAPVPVKPAIPVGEDGIVFILRQAGIDTPVDDDVEDVRGDRSFTRATPIKHYESNFSLHQKEDLENSMNDNQVTFQQFSYGKEFRKVDQKKSMVNDVHTILTRSDDPSIIYTGAGWIEENNGAFFFGKETKTAVFGEFFEFDFNGVSVGAMFDTVLGVNAQNFFKVELSEDGGATYGNEITKTVVSDDSDNEPHWFYNGLDINKRYRLKLTVLTQTGDPVGLFYMATTTYGQQIGATAKAVDGVGGVTGVNDLPINSWYLNGADFTSFAGVAVGDVQFGNFIGHRTSVNGDFAELRFFGSRIWLTTQGRNSVPNTFSVLIDGVTTHLVATTIDTNQPANTRPLDIRLDDGTLPEGFHTLKIEKISGGDMEFSGAIIWSAISNSITNSVIGGSRSKILMADDSSVVASGIQDNFTDDTMIARVNRRANSIGNFIEFPTPPSDVKAIYFCTSSDTAGSTFKATLDGLVPRFLSTQATGFQRGSETLQIYHSLVDGDLNGKTLRIENQEAKNLHYGAVIFQIGDIFDDNHLHCMLKRTRFADSTGQFACQSTAKRMDVFGDSEDDRPGIIHPVHSGWLFGPLADSVHYRPGLGLKPYEYTEYFYDPLGSPGFADNPATAVTFLQSITNDDMAQLRKNPSSGSDRFYLIVLQPTRVV